MPPESPTAAPAVAASTPAASTDAETLAADSPSPAEPVTDDSSPADASTSDVVAGNGTRTLDCGDLSGSGTFTDPYQLGDVTGPTVAEDCSPMTPGYGFNARYFSFTLPNAPGSEAYAGASFVLTADALGPVYPQIDSTGGWILRDALTSGYWTGTDPDFTGRYQDISGLDAGTYIMLEEKMDSPEHSMTTPYFNVVVDPAYSD